MNDRGKVTFTILVVDDHPDTLLAVEATLSDYSILKAKSGGEALRLLLHEHIDLVLLDVRLPDMDGFDTAKLIRERKQTENIPIIFMSAIDKTDPKVFEGYQAGGIDYIFKPFVPSLLKAKVSVFVNLFERTYKLQESEAELMRTNQKLTDSFARLEAANVELRGEIENRLSAEKTLKESEKKLKELSSQLFTAQETERRRIANELHDSVLASLGAVIFGIEKIIDGTEQDETTRAGLRDLILKIQQANDEIRTIMSALRPSLLDDLGVAPAMYWFCREYEKTYSHICVEKQIDISEEKLSDSIRTAIFRISQEAMNNIAKHSKATGVRIDLKEVNSGGIELSIRDNGQGFDPKIAGGGMGLSTMRERAELSGGTYGIESTKGVGTTIQCSWPSGCLKEQVNTESL